MRYDAEAFEAGSVFTVGDESFYVVYDPTADHKYIVDKTGFQCPAVIDTGGGSQLEVVEVIPPYRIEEYDGSEYVVDSSSLWS